MTLRSDKESESLESVLSAHVFRDPETLMVLPESATYALKLSRKKHLELEDVVDCALIDPLLGARLFSVANSARFRGDVQVTTIRMAAARLGTTGCRDLLLQYAAMRMMSINRPAYDALLRKVLERCIRSAQVARAIAPRFALDTDTAYLAALMQDLGYARCAQIFAQHLKATPTESAMIEAIESVHCIVGAQLVHAWKLPPEVAEVCLHHDAPGNRPLSLLVYVANRIVVVCEGDKLIEAELTANLLGFGFTNAHVVAMMQEACRELQRVA